MKLGIPKEVHPGERRVAATPDTAKGLQTLGFTVLVEAGAGAAAHFDDEAYAAAGCTVVADRAALWREADGVIKVRPPTPEEVDLLREGSVLVSFLYPAQNRELLEALAARKATVLAMDQVPRITRAQKMDALSSMANIAGYRAVVEGAYEFGRFFAGQITAAGRVPPAKVLVIGAGVAGLAAIGAARGLGAVVRAFDARAEVKDQVKSMGAEFLEVDIQEDATGEGGYAKEVSQAFLEAEMALFRRQAEEVDVIITTALVPGKRAPVLITEDMVRRMRPGSVIVDLAAEQGGNCACTRPGEKTVAHGVTILGYTDLPSRMATIASQMYGTNMVHLLEAMGGAEKFHVDLEDEVVRGALVAHRGKITWPPPKPAGPPPPPKPAPAPAAAAPTKKKRRLGPLWLAVAGLLLVGVGLTGDRELLTDFTVFVLAIIVGWLVIWNVTPALHTPLMSVTNAISGIIIIGGLLQIGSEHTVAAALGVVAILVAMINVCGGFLVTQRMLKMFRK